MRLKDLTPDGVEYLDFLKHCRISEVLPRHDRLLAIAQARAKTIDDPVILALDPAKTLMVSPVHKARDAVNAQRLGAAIAAGSTHVVCWAHDKFRAPAGTSPAKVRALRQDLLEYIPPKRSNSAEAAPLLSSSHFCIGARVIVTHGNDGTAVGLGKQMLGSVVGFLYRQTDYDNNAVRPHCASAADAASSDEVPALPIVLVRVDPGADGKYDFIGYDTEKYGPGVVPIAPITQQFRYGGKQGFTVTRTMLGLSLGWATTVHCAQGLSLANIIFLIDGMFERAQAYVAFSRPTTFAGMYLISQCGRPIKHAALNTYKPRVSVVEAEYTRLAGAPAANFQRLLAACTVPDVLTDAYATLDAAPAMLQTAPLSSSDNSMPGARVDRGAAPAAPAAPATAAQRPATRASSAGATSATKPPHAGARTGGHVDAGATWTLPHADRSNAAAFISRARAAHKPHDCCIRAYDVCATHADVATLHGIEYLADGVMDAFLAIAPLEMAAPPLILPVTWYHMLTEHLNGVNDPSTVAASIELGLAGFNRKNHLAGNIIIPVATGRGGNHYICLVVSADAKRIVVYDPLGSPDSYIEILNNVRDFFDQVNPTALGVWRITTAPLAGAFPLQTDGTSCGVLVSAFVWFFCRHGRFPVQGDYTQDNVPAIRLCIAHTLLAHAAAPREALVAPAPGARAAGSAGAAASVPTARGCESAPKKRRPDSCAGAGAAGGCGSASSAAAGGSTGSSMDIDADRSQTLLRSKLRLRPRHDIDAVNSARDPKLPVSEVLAHSHRLIIRRGDMLRLRDLDSMDTWLNDELINFYGAIINTRYFPVESASASAAAAEPPPPPVHVWSSFFYTKLTEDTLSPQIPDEDGTPVAASGKVGTKRKRAPSRREVLERGYNYDNVRRWTTKLGYDISTMQCVLFPLHLHGNHWACAVLWPQLRRYAYIDSWAGNATSKESEDYMSILKRWYRDEYNDKHAGAAGAAPLTEADMAAWERVKPSVMPLQDNWVDCGIFTLMALEWVAAGLEDDLAYTQAHVSKLRQYIAACILQDEIL